MKLKFSEMTLKGIGKTAMGVLMTGIAIAASIVGLVYGILRVTQKNYCYEIFKSKAELAYYSTKDDLVKCMDTYILTMSPESAMNGFAILDQCDKYNVDIRFVLIQAQVEGNFATRGIAARTHSAFNVHAYDGRTAEDMIRNGHCYKHPDESIEPYLKLLTSDYLVDGKTEMDLLDKFVNKDGKRYASNQAYEQTLRYAYQQLIETTNITPLYSEYQKYKMICGK